TGYVSYALTVLLSGITFLLWWALIGISTEDSRIFYWLTINTILIIILQPWLMRLSRAVYIYFFISYDENYEATPIRELHIDEH
ncbi:MAG: DUF983 domain-containing protein, partial [Chitinophagaceae bacterium]